MMRSALDRSSSPIEITHFYKETNFFLNLGDLAYFEDKEQIVAEVFIFLPVSDSRLISVH